MDIGPAPTLETAPPVPGFGRPATEIYYGGPDQPPRALRDLLKARIDAAPPGSEITWATYYFRDQELADSLVAAQRRGVRVRIRIEGSPRRQGQRRRHRNLTRGPRRRTAPAQVLVRRRPSARQGLRLLGAAARGPDRLLQPVRGRDPRSQPDRGYRRPGPRPEPAGGIPRPRRGARASPPG